MRVDQVSFDKNLSTNNIVTKEFHSSDSNDLRDKSMFIADNTNQIFECIEYENI